MYSRDVSAGHQETRAQQIIALQDKMMGKKKPIAQIGKQQAQKAR